MKYIIYDLSNWVRLQFANDTSGFAVRNVWNQIATPNADLRLFVGDGFNCNARRRAFYPLYKTKRPPAQDFIYEGIKLIKELLAYAPSTVGFVEVSGYEADDVIADVAAKFPEVTIMSTDKDLTAIPNASNPLTRENWCPKRWVYLYKCLVGDPSDNIAGVKGFGKGAWDKLTERDKEVLWEYFKTRKIVGEIPDKVARLSLQEVEDLYKVVTPCKVEEKYEINFGNGRLDLAEEILKKEMC